MSESLDEEYSLLLQKEEWIQTIADSICSKRGISRETALSGARWASLWVDDFKTLAEEREPATNEEVKQLIEESRTSSQGRCTGLELYPTGVPTIRTIVSAHDAFCLAFGDEAGMVRELLASEPAK